jgi:TPR repeat protein
MRAALLAAALLLGRPALAATIESAQASFAAGDFESAVAQFRTLAEAGNPVAQYNLGVLYENGQGVPKDYARAVEWYRKGAEQGYSEAQNNLANMYAFGLGVPQDAAEAVVWLRRAAQQGQSGAQYNLGIMYTLGQGVPKDYEQAEAWLRLAAGQGEVEAQYNLGVMYERGDGVAADVVEAYAWYLAAAAQGFEPAQPKLVALRAAMSDAQRTQAEKLAADRAARGAGSPRGEEAPTSGGRTGLALGALALLAALGGAAAWKLRGKPKAAAAGAGAAPPFSPPDEAALLRSAGDPKACEKVARYYSAAGRAADLWAKKDRPAAFYGAYGRAFLKLSDLASALALLELKLPPEPADETLIWTLQKSAGEQGASAEWGWRSRLSAAMDLSVQGLQEEAVSLMDAEIMKEAAASEAVAERVQSIYRAAGREAEYAIRKPRSS